MGIEPLVAHFSKYLPLEEPEQEELRNRTIHRSIKRRQFILQEGDVCRHYTFVVAGLFKMYMVDDNGKEHNLQFAVENNWIADIGSFHSELPSELYIEALEPSNIIQINKPDLLSLYTSFPAFDRNFRVLIENAFVSLQKRMLQSISSTAEERYINFMETYPDLLNRISSVQVASYLGVTPEFLSAIRKKISKS